MPMKSLETSRRQKNKARLHVMMMHSSAACDAVLYGIGELCYLSLSSFYGSGYLYGFNLYSAAGQLAYFWMVCRPLIISAAAIVLAVIGARILKALAKILERS